MLRLGMLRLGLHKLLLVTFIGSVALLANASVDAADGRPQAKTASTSPFATLDRNGDHRISRSEAGFDRLLSQTFAEIDTDGDGFVSPAEFAAAEKNRTAVTDLVPR